MKLTILGTGTAAPRLDRHMPGCLLKSGSDLLLIDPGPGTLYQILKTRTEINNIDNILLTHHHWDHIGDLGTLIWSYRHGTGRTEPLHIHGPESTGKIFEALSKLMGIGKPTHEIIIHENEKEFSVKNLKIKTGKTNHQTNSIGYRFERAGKSLVITGDAVYCPELIELSKKADVLVTECSFPADMKIKKHLNPEECGLIARSAGVKTLILTHFYPEVDRTDIKGEVRKSFKGEIILAEDMMEVEV